MADVSNLAFVDLEFTGDSDGEAGDKAVPLLDGTLVQMLQITHMFEGSIFPVRVADVAVWRMTGAAAEVQTVIDRYNLLADP